MFLNGMARCTRSLAAAVVALVTLTLLAAPAEALPSFSRQTGQDCATCHAGAYGPLLTPYGMKFKLGGYTESSAPGVNIPASFMAIWTATHTQKKQDGGAAPGFKANDNVATQELSAFLAGKVVDHVGAFVQVTYSGVDKSLALDNADIRAATEMTLFGSTATTGISLNNNPTLSDPFNSLPAWRLPAILSDLAPQPSHAPMLDGGLEQRVIGMTAYTMLGSGLYLEGGGYGAPARALLQDVNAVDPSDPGQNLVGIAPYGRLAYFQDLKSQSFSFGLVAFAPNVRSYGASGPTDRYTDLGVDASYQYLGNRRNVVTLNAAYITEWQRLGETYAASGAASKSQTMQQASLSANYAYDKTYSLMARAFYLTGSSDALLYPGSGKPDTTGLTLQADWTPFGKDDSWGAPYANLRLGVQYTAYGLFDGARTNYDGTGRSASDNNTFMAFLTTSF